MKDTITFKVKSNITHKYYYRKVVIAKSIITSFTEDGFELFLRDNVYINLIDTIVNYKKAYKKFLKKFRKYYRKKVDKYFASML